MQTKKQIECRIIPNSKRNEIVQIFELNDSFKLKIKVAAIPEDDKANKELIRYFKKIWKINCEIVKGHHSRDKILNIREADQENFLLILNSLKELIKKN